MKGEGHHSDQGQAALRTGWDTASGAGSSGRCATTPGCTWRRGRGRPAERAAAGGAYYKSRHATGRGGAVPEPGPEGSEAQACAVVLGSGGAGPAGCPLWPGACGRGWPRPLVERQQRREGRGRGEQLRVRLSGRRPAARGRGTRWAAALRSGHGSVAPESVHRGLGELVSCSGPAARDPLPGSPSAGRARAARPHRGVGTAHRAPRAGRRGGRPRAGPVSAPREAEPRRSARRHWARGGRAPAGTCLRSRHRTAGARRPPALHSRVV